MTTTSEVQVWVGIIGSLVTISVSVLGVLNFQRRRDQAAIVGARFKDVVTSLASDNETLRMSAAILLRRFFDIRSEQGAGRRSYANEAVAVIAGLLRESDTGPVQKALADGLRYAPCLCQADLQGCNLTGAYLGQKEGDKKIVNLTNADLFEADLTAASLKGINAAGAAFVGATLVRTVLSGATLIGANFQDANLTDADFRGAKLDGAKFDGARIDGARFSGAQNIPADVASRLRTQKRSVRGQAASVFLGVPAVLTARQQPYLEQWLRWLEDQDLEVVRLERNSYGRDPWLTLTNLLSHTDGAVLLGFRQLDARTAIWRPYTKEEARAVGWWTSGWLNVEAGMAVALGLPLLVAPDEEVTEGAFSSEVWNGHVHGTTLGSPGEARIKWLNLVREHGISRSQGIAEEV